MKEFNTQLEFAQDMIDYYWGNSEKLCKLNDVCQYSAIPDKSEGCAIGRHLSKEQQQRFDTVYNGKAVVYYVLFAELPQWMQNLSSLFLRKCQNIHDGGDLVQKNKHTITNTLRAFIDTSKLVFPE